MPNLRKKFPTGTAGQLHRDHEELDVEAHEQEFPVAIPSLIYLGTFALGMGLWLLFLLAIGAPFWILSIVELFIVAPLAIVPTLWYYMRTNGRVPDYALLYPAIAGICIVGFGFKYWGIGDSDMFLKVGIAGMHTVVSFVLQIAGFNLLGAWVSHSNLDEF